MRGGCDDGFPMRALRYRDYERLGMSVQRPQTRRERPLEQSASESVTWLVVAALLLSLMLLVIIFMVPVWTANKLPDAVQLAAVVVLGVSILVNLLFIMAAGFYRMR